MIIDRRTIKEVIIDLILMIIVCFVGLTIYLNFFA